LENICGLAGRLGGFAGKIIFQALFAQDVAAVLERV